MRATSAPAVRALAARGVHTEAKIEEMGLKLPTPPTPAANYIMCHRVGNLLFTAGHLPMQEDGQLFNGKVGKDFTTEEAYTAARQCALAILGTVKAEIGDLDKVKRVVKLTGFVNCVDAFSAQPKVLNGASDFMGEVLGERGVHVRSAVGTNALPMNVPVEVEAIIEIDE
mmetsp:Transcript_3857/g.15933  ORF Transcript_3857/g.15933 Transcript_3857/m.15933 type:complete len:170 (-) Transcript_3857:187-696(-)